MKNKFIPVLLLCSAAAFAQQQIRGTVLEEHTLSPVTGILVAVKDSETAVRTDGNGQFSLTGTGWGTRLRIMITGGGYQPQEMTVNLPLKDNFRIIMSARTADIEAVSLMTGYQKIAKERATGAFSTVSGEMLNKQVTTNIIERLPAVANGILTDNTTGDMPQLMVRGLSTMQGPKNPLIILDDFPYEGNLSNINPDMVASVTVLKDAAASSIWGARAANGVIVITTKKGKFNKAVNIEFTVNTTLTGKPDLSYLRQISSSDFIDVEQELFARGFYDSDINSPNHAVLTPVVDLLNRAKARLISQDEARWQINLLRQTDVRGEYRKHMYSPALKQQYAVNLSGGSTKLSWISGFGYDKNTGNLAEEFERTNFRLQNTWKASDKLSISSGVLYAGTKNQSGRTGYGSVKVNGNWQIPYLQFADAEGNPLVVFSGYDQRYKESLAGSGLLDWNYYPLTDWQHTRTTGRAADLILNTSVQYQLFKGLEADIRYQYQRTDGNTETLQDADSYFARNYINGFAYYDSGTLKFRVPKGGILDRSRTVSAVNNLRAQLNYQYLSGDHEISAIAGAETRATQVNYDQTRDYGYHSVRQSSMSVDFLNPYPNFVSGATTFIQNRRSIQERNANFVSLYANAAYTFGKKYTVSGSARRDASNLFGLKTNDQWNPFWSGGAAWKISDENFYPVRWLPLLKLRGSYGFNGNIDPAMVAVTTIVYDTNASTYTGTGMARIDQYYNPRLRWETLRMVNVAVDFATLNSRISGSVDFFVKKGSNLFGTAPLDYTTGISWMLMNVAGMKGKGIDVELRTRNFANGPFLWDTMLNFSTYRDKVTAYYTPNTSAANFVSTAGSSVLISGTEGLPVYAMFGYKWAGLDPETGNPRGYLDGEVSTDYAAITGAEKGIETLQYFGSAIPTTYGSLVNSFGYRGLTCDIGLTYKLGYWFRRSSIDYSKLISDRNGHSDFGDRWQQPGDEAFTDVPSVVYTTNSGRDDFYNGSAVLVEKGDHVRLQFLNVGYELRNNPRSGLPVNSMKVYCAINNLGILWRANKHKLDPDHSFGTYTLKPVTNYSLGLHLKF